jgi:hypothetical protein
METAHKKLLKPRPSEHLLELLAVQKHLSAKIKITLHKGLIRSVITYACPTGE